jgi:hypothetical protein
MNHAIVTLQRHHERIRKLASSGNEEFERADAGAAHGHNQFFAKRPKLRENGRQGASCIRRRQGPEVVKLSQKWTWKCPRFEKCLIVTICQVCCS